MILGIYHDLAYVTNRGILTERRTIFGRRLYMKGKWCRFCKDLYPSGSNHWILRKKKRSGELDLYCAKADSDQRDRRRKACKMYQKRAEFKDQHKRYTLRSRYDLSHEEFERMFSDQGGRCKICRREARLCVDHCHESGKVRGLLCSGCNRGLGFFRDDSKALSNAVQYLADAKIDP
jgi:hypothetical protein